MALFRCVGDILVKRDITVSGTSGWVNWDANQYVTFDKTFDNLITPIKVEIYAKSEIYNGGSGPGTWAEAKTYFYLHEKNGSWVLMGSLRVGADYNIPTYQNTILLDISSQTAGKKYDKMRIEVGHGSSDCTSRKTGRATIKEYKV